MSERRAVMKAIATRYERSSRAGQEGDSGCVLCSDGPAPECVAGFSGTRDLSFWRLTAPWRCVAFPDLSGRGSSAGEGWQLDELFA